MYTLRVTFFESTYNPDKPLNTYPLFRKIIPKSNRLISLKLLRRHTWGAHPSKIPPFVATSHRRTKSSNSYFIKALIFLRSKLRKNRRHDVNASLRFLQNGVENSPCEKKTHRRDDKGNLQKNFLIIVGKLISRSLGLKKKNCDTFEILLSHGSRWRGISPRMNLLYIMKSTLS